MRSLLPSLFLAAVALLPAPTARAQSIIQNGNFDDPTNPLKGWVTDYEWLKNDHYMKNKTFVTIAQEGARKNIAVIGSNGDDGVYLETRAFPFEPGFKYTATLDVKGRYRIYFDGYKWMPGIRPHDNPELGELRELYRSKEAKDQTPNWKSEKVELPGVKLSESAIEHLKPVRFLTLKIWMDRPGAVDNVVITKVPDPTMKFEQAPAPTAPQ